MDVLLNQTDEYILRECLKDIELFGILINRYTKKLSQYIQRKSGASKEDTEDILQNVFIKVYKNIHDFDKDLSFSSWIYRITHNETIDWYRKKKRRPTISFEDDETLIEKITDEINIEKEIIQKESIEKIRTSIRTLTPEYQNIVELRFFEDKSYDEISDILMIPKGTVAIRINRVKKKLQELLHEYRQ